MEPIIPNPEFFIPGTFEVEPPYREGDPENLHQGGLDTIDPAYDPIHTGILTGAIGFDPADYASTSLETQQDIEPNLPQWGPPFVTFVDKRITELEKKVDKAIERWSFEPVTAFYMASVQTTATGGLDQATTPNCIFLEPPPGFTFALHRLEVLTPGTAFTFASPFNGAGSYWEFRVNNEARDGGSLVANAPLRPFGLPFVVTYGTRDAPRVRDGEIGSLFLNAGPNSTKITIKAQGTLDRTQEG
jgi:hypothetical protein